MYALASLAQSTASRSVATPLALLPIVPMVLVNTVQGAWAAVNRGSVVRERVERE